MDARLQRRVQRYGWDLAAPLYESAWHAPLAPAQEAVLQAAAPAPGEHVLDVACGTGLALFSAARAVGNRGRALGVDVSQRMLDTAAALAPAEGLAPVAFARMDAESLALADASFDICLCALGLMYMPDPVQALREMRRVLRPGGRLAATVWGERRQCGWSGVFPIVDAEVKSEVCPLFFRLGEGEALARAAAQAGLHGVASRRIGVCIVHADAQSACEAAFAAGPVALAWSRFGPAQRARLCHTYLQTIAAWRQADGSYRIPGEFVVLTALAP